MQQPLLKHAVNANALLYFRCTFRSTHHLWTTLRQLFIVAKQGVIQMHEILRSGCLFSLLEFDLAGELCSCSADEEFVALDGLLQHDRGQCAICKLELAQSPGGF